MNEEDVKQRLFNLNFKNLLKYQDNFPIQNRYDDESKLVCYGFCTECEDKGKVSEDEVLMSHGCHSSVYQELIQEKNTFTNNEPIMFLLENPGGDYGNGDSVTYNSITKKPPVKHFYFTPNCESWPGDDDINIIAKNPYGNYFAYLMQKYSLGNVYITNCIKCKYTENYEASKNCCKKWLEEEIEIFKPTKIVCFGCKAEKLYNYYFKRYGIEFKRLLHPAARRSRSYIIKENDQRLTDFFK